jgi:hypothetical protein
MPVLQQEPVKFQSAVSRQPDELVSRLLGSGIKEQAPYCVAVHVWMADLAQQQKRLKTKPKR